MIRDKEINIFDGNGTIHIDGAARSQLFEAMKPDWAIKGASFQEELEIKCGSSRIIVQRIGIGSKNTDGGASLNDL